MVRKQIAKVKLKSSQSLCFWVFLQIQQSLLQILNGLEPGGLDFSFWESLLLSHQFSCFASQQVWQWQVFMRSGQIMLVQRILMRQKTTIIMKAHKHWSGALLMDMTFGTHRKSYQGLWACSYNLIFTFCDRSSTYAVC